MADDENASVARGDVPTGRAKNRGGPALTPAQKALRDAAIVASLHAGHEAREVAKEFGITKRSVERIKAAFQLAPTALDSRPMEIVERSLRTYEQQMETFMRVAVDTLSRAPAVCIAALKGHADAHERYLMLLSDIGKLPENLELFRAENEMVRVGGLLLEQLGRLERGEVTGPEVAEFMRRVFTSHAPLDTWEGSARELPAGDVEGGGMTR